MSGKVKKGEIDIQVYIAFSKERAKKIDFTDVTLMSNWGEVYANPAADITNIFDLDGRRVAILKNAIHALAFNDFIHKFDIHPEIIELKSHKEVFEYVNLNKADAGITNKVYGLLHSEEYNIVRTPIFFNPIEIRYASPKGKNKNLRLAIDSHLTRLKNDKKSIYYQLFDEAFMRIYQKLKKKGKI